MCQRIFIKFMRLFINQCDLEFNRVKIMGILNVTPDSFFDGGNYCTFSKAIDHADYMIAHGATFIDVGGESTRPGANPISEEEEADRVIPVIYGIAKRFDVFISVNTSSALVIRESATAGAHLINDIRSLASQEAMQAVLCCKLPICLVHMQGNPQIMQKCPKYYDVIYEVNEYFMKQVKRCEAAGIARSKLLIDPGFGFGKNLIHNYQLLSNLKYFHHFELPILVGMSRKSMLGNIHNRNKCNNGVVAPEQRLMGSIACVIVAAMQGVHIVRVHDVKETAEALCVVDIMCEV